MKDEIKEILDELKNEDYYIEDFGFRYKRIALDDVWHLLDYITNLQEKIKQYEDPEDLTLFYMWLDEKAKDKLTNLQEENERLKDIRNQAIDYNKVLCKIYDRGIKLSIAKTDLCILKDNAETNLCILEDEETINLLQGKSDE